MRQFLLLLSATILILEALYAANPILPGYADPHMKVWGDKMYIAVGKDESPDNKNFFIIHWDIYSSSDLINWSLESHIDPKSTYLGENYKYCWAPDIAQRGGKYYFYFSNHHEATGVLVADKPNGPYVDVLKKPFVAPDYSINHEYDPTIFVDDDGQYYIIYGRDGQLGKNLVHFQIAKLSDDMLSFAEKPHNLLTSEPYGFGNAKIAQDHQYFHKYKDTYYLSCAGAYTTSKNIYGPYTNLRHTGQNGHSSFCEYNGQWYHMYEWSCEPYGNRMYRQVLMTYLHYKENGDMVSDPMFLQATNAVKVEGRYYKTGVGNYDAQWDAIQSEWYFKKQGQLVKKESPNGGFEIQNIQNGDYLIFPHVKNMTTDTPIYFYVSSKTATKRTQIEVRQNNPQGELLGTCSISKTGSWDNYQIAECRLKNGAPESDLCFVFKGGSGELLRLDWFNFSPKQRP